MNMNDNVVKICFFGVGFESKIDNVTGKEKNNITSQNILQLFIYIWCWPQFCCQYNISIFEL